MFHGMRVLGLAMAIPITVWLLTNGLAQSPRSYVGSKACADCHAAEYESFTNHANKAKSGRGIRMMAAKLTPDELRECYSCHTTGYGQPGGFVSFEQTPDMGHAGCEVCHGPGSDHILTGASTDIQGRMDMSVCAPCHEDERVRRINYKPLLQAGAH